MKTFEINWDLVIKAAQVAATPIAAYCVYQFAKRNMKHETQERLSRFRYDKKYEAGMAFWGLLAYTTLAENKDTIVFWEKEKHSQGKKYYLHKANAERFMEQLNSINYEKGYGLFLDLDTRELFYNYRGILFGFLLTTKNIAGEKILIENFKMVEDMKQLHDQMIRKLRDEMNLRTAPQIKK